MWCYTCGFWVMTYDLDFETSRQLHLVFDSSHRPTWVNEKTGEFLGDLAEANEVKVVIDGNE